MNKKVKRAIIVGVVMFVLGVLGLIFFTPIGQFRLLFILPIGLGIIWPIKVATEISQAAKI